MAILEFPDIESADNNGLLGIGGDLEVPSLLLAYRSGIFPWPFEENEEIPWFSPPKRAVKSSEASLIPIPILLHLLSHRGHQIVGKHFKSQFLVSFVSSCPS